MSLACFEVIGLNPQTTRRNLSQQSNEAILHIYIYNNYQSDLQHCSEDIIR